MTSKSFAVPASLPPSFSLAFTLSALALYLPANLLPIMRFQYFGAVQTNTIWQGVQNLWRGHMHLVAIVVFLFSLAAPFLKLVMLLGVIRPAATERGRALQRRLYILLRVIETWSMLDIFLLAILVALVKLGQLANVDAQMGALAFTLMVIFSLAASQTFDPSLLESSDDAA
jgi:paraquat-inducible protein A